MEMKKIFACQKCDEDIEIEDVYNTDTAICHNCGQSYTLRYVEREQAWELIPVEAVEEEQTRQLAEEKEDEPFQVLREPAAPRDDDIERFE